MSRGMNKSERLQEMIRLYSLRAYSDIEMAERLGVDRTTVYRDRRDLELEHFIIQDDEGRYKIDRGQYIPAIKLNLHEALALYLAARRASRQTRIAQPHVAGALEKLAVALRQPMTERLVRAAAGVLDQAAQAERVKVLEIVTQAWAEQRKVRITHHSLTWRQARHYIVSPYLIEPSLWSDGAYLVGHSDYHGGVATFKIERIEHAFLTSETFTIPESFDDRELLKHAWGIWYGDKEPVTVRLRFAPGEAARRLQESTWHATQEVTPGEDGGCVWTAQVAEWQEMLPWVRGWGADCEVLEPKEMREVLLGQAKALAERYGWSVSRQAAEQQSTVLDDFFGG